MTYQAFGTPVIDQRFTCVSYGAFFSGRPDFGKYNFSFMYIGLKDIGGRRSFASLYVRIIAERDGSGE